MKTKILITGSSGFIGYNLSLHLLRNKNNQIFGIDNLDSYYSIKMKKKRTEDLKKSKNFKYFNLNICDQKKIKKKLKNIKFDFVFHFAAQAGVRYSYNNPIKYIDTNIYGFSNLIENINFSKLKKFFYASSSSVYGDQKIFPVSENSRTKPKNVYALSKKFNEEMAIYYSKIKKSNFIGLRFFSIFGNSNRPDMLISKLYQSSKKNIKVPLFNNGNHFRDFTFIDDVCKILENLMKIKIKNQHEVINICSNKPQKVAKIVKLFNKANLFPKIIKKPKHFADSYKTHGSNLKLKKLLKNKLSFTEFKKALKKTIETF